MKSYFQSLYKILVSIFNYFFAEDTKTQKRTAYEKLISASVCDRTEFIIKPIRIYYKSCKDLTEQSLIQEKEQILRNAPLIPDIKKQFRIWSANMREYDSIRKRLIDSVPAQSLNSNILFVQAKQYSYQWAYGQGMVPVAN